MKTKDQLPIMVQKIDELAKLAHEKELEFDYYPDDWGPSLTSYLDKVLSENSDGIQRVFYVHLQESPVFCVDLQDSKIYKNYMGLKGLTESGLKKELVSYFSDYFCRCYGIGGFDDTDPIIVYLRWLLDELNKL